MTADPHEHRSAGDGDSDAAPYAAALAALPGAGPATLVQILGDWTPAEAWRRVRDGRLSRPRSHRTSGGRQLDIGLSGTDGDTRSPPGHSSDPGPGFQGETPDPSWREFAGRIDPPGWWARHAAAGIGVTWPGRLDYPSALINDPERPGVLFWRGDLRHLARPSVAVVGTRRATIDGRSVAFELGRDLAAAGVCVVSGLALGIDGAAHAGALSGRQPSPVRADASSVRPPSPDAGALAGAGVVAGAVAGVVAGPAGVAASGVDVPYPHQHAGLWEQVVTSGVMLSETLPGRPAQPWRFPARNRIIAGLSAMVVIVESHAAGGSLITADAAMARGVEVRVVPGPVHSSASAGSNQLLYDGPGPVRHAQDVLDGLGIFAGGPPAPPAGTSQALSDEARRVLDAVGWQPTLLSQVMDRTGLTAGAASRALDFLKDAGMMGMDDHWWVRRSDR